MSNFSIDFAKVRTGGAGAEDDVPTAEPILHLRDGKGLPVYQPRVLDHSTIEAHARCPRKAFYSYYLRRGPIGTNYPIGWGVVYHKFRELLDVQWLSAIEEGRHPKELVKDVARVDQMRRNAFELSTANWEDPPPEHKKAWMTYDRLSDTLDMGYERWLTEKRQGEIIVLFTERAFELFLPSGRPYGGRMDQIVMWNGKLWARDFKTTSRMGASFPQQFEPNNQMTGYTWAAKEISLRDVEGVIIEVPYNTKTKGPEIHQFLSTRNKGHLEQWIASIEDEQDNIELHLARTKERGLLAWPMRTTSCSDYGGCYYRGACQQSTPVMVEKWLEANTKYSEWDFTNPEGEEAETE